MSAALISNNLLAYALQIVLLVGVGASLPSLLRLRMPRSRLLFWQVLLAACLALPWVRPWRRQVVDGAIQVSAVITAIAAPASAHRVVPYREITLWLLAAGVAIRLIWLAIGMMRLSGYRRRGYGLTAVSPILPAHVPLLVSDEVTGPVTFGWRNPVVLLPANFVSLGVEMQDAILCHELMHVERRDWLFTVGEELVRAVLWFHPAIWWVIGEIQLAREQTVDQSVIEITQAREPYVDALLLMSGALDSARMDLAPAPMFLRRRHLKRRLMEAMREARMKTVSRTQSICAQAVAVLLLAGAGWLATGAFPLRAAPQMVADAAGVAVNMNGSPLMHRSSVPYPAEALAKGIEGTVVVQVRLDANGEVNDAAVLSGPDELRRGVLQSVLAWHFDKSAALTTRTVNIDFVKPAAAATAQPVRQLQPLERQGIYNASRSAMAPTSAPASGKLSHIFVTGLSESARGELLASLPVQEGGVWTAQTFAAVKLAASEFDPHLTTTLAMTRDGQLELRLSLAGTAGGQAIPTIYLPAGVFSVGHGVTAPMPVFKVDPVYSDEARAEKLSGEVEMTLIIDTDGKPEDIQVRKSDDSRLNASAIEAVNKWIFRPGTKDGLPVKVRAMIAVNFRML